MHEVNFLAEIVQQPRKVMSLPQAMQALERGELERPTEGLPSLVMAPKDYVEIR